MSNNTILARALRSRQLAQAFAQVKGARIGVHNRYKYDYACEDEYFEREMTIFEGRTLPLPLPADFKHKSIPYHEDWPAHWNDVRFNYLPQNRDRRMFMHDNLAPAYDFKNDAFHTLGYKDEDLDYEMPDPYEAMHFKRKRSPAFASLGAIICFAILFGYPIFGLKMPQKDNPFYWRKKYALSTTIDQFQNVALMEYGAAVPKGMDTNVILGPKGFDHNGNGVRFDLDNYNDLIQ